MGGFGVRKRSLFMAGWITSPATSRKRDWGQQEMQSPAGFPTGPCTGGGAGIRTPVRDKIYHSHYVRSSPIRVCSNWPVSGPLLHKPPWIFARRQEARRQTIPILRYSRRRLGRASSGARLTATPKSYAARAISVLAVVGLPRVLPGPSTWARSHSFTDPVEAKSPPRYSSLTPCMLWGSPQKSIGCSTGGEGS